MTKAKAEEAKRHIFMGRVSEELGLDKTTELLKELQPTFDQLDSQAPPELTIDSAVAIVDEVMQEMANFLSEEDKQDFILDFTVKYQKRLKKSQE